MPQTTRPLTAWPKSVMFGVAGALAVAVLLLAFMWPTKTAEVHNLPVSVTGPAQSVTALKSALDEKSPGMFDFVDATSRDDAVAQIKERTTYGAIVLAEAPGAPEVLTAPAGNATATQLLTGVATQLQAQLTQQLTAAGQDPSAAQVTVTPVVPLSEHDTTGSGLAAASLPMTMGGMIGGAMIAFTVVGGRRRLAAIGGLAVAAAVIMPLIMQTWFHFLQGSFVENGLAIGLSIAATASLIVGLDSVAGRAGLGLGAAITMLLGNPLAAAALPWQFTLHPWGAMGQLMVPGASNWLLRSLSYFPDASTVKQWSVLGAWILVGIVLTIVGHARGNAAKKAVAVSSGSAETTPQPTLVS